MQAGVLTSHTCPQLLAEVLEPPTLAGPSCLLATLVSSSRLGTEAFLGRGALTEWQEEPEVMPARTAAPGRSSPQLSTVSSRLWMPLFYQPYPSPRLFRAERTWTITLSCVHIHLCLPGQHRPPPHLPAFLCTPVPYGCRPDRPSGCGQITGNNGLLMIIHESQHVWS